MGIIITIIAALLAIFSVIIIHELGHFFVARWCGVKILKFSIGFGKALWSYTSKKSGTEYVIAILPLGGYVRMLGEGEPVADPKDLEYAYHRKPLWKRMAIVAAGPVMNLILAILLFYVIFLIGVVHIKPVVGQVQPNSIAAQSGLKKDDEIVKISHWRTPNWQRVMMSLVLSIGKKQLSVTVKPLSSGKLQVKRMDLSKWKFDQRNPRLFESLGFMPFFPKVTPVIAKVLKNSPASQAGLKAGDKVLAINQQPISDWMALLKKIQESPDKKMQFLVQRDGSNKTLMVTVGSKKVGDKLVGHLGIYSSPPQWPSNMRQVLKYSFLSAWWPAVNETFTIFSFNALVLGKMIIGKISLAALGGPITIVQTAGKASHAGLTVYLGFIAFISITLAFINILPIPGLDGGHLFFQIIEGLIGRPLPNRLQMLLLRIGIVILILLMIQATMNDIIRIFHI